MKTLLIIKTEYATIEKICINKFDAWKFLKDTMDNHTVITYEFKPAG